MLVISLILIQGSMIPVLAYWSGEGSGGYSVAYDDAGSGGTGGSGAEEMNTSQPRLMVTEFEIDGGSVRPNHETTLFITFQNCSTKKFVSNIKLTIQDETGDIVPIGTGSKYVPYIYAGESYLWDVDVKASKTAAVGEHKLTITAEYEDKYYTAFTNTDTVLVPVKQKTNLDYSGLQLSKSVVQDSTETMEITLMNTGKSLVRNAKIDVDMEGLVTGGTTFIGEIPAGTSQKTNINLQVDPTKEGLVKGTATLTYEDEYGKEYKQKQTLSTTIEKKKEVVNESEKEKEDKSKVPFWWAFLLGGMGTGGAAGVGGMKFMQAKKQLKEDEMRL